MNSNEDVISALSDRYFNNRDNRDRDQRENSDYIDKKYQININVTNKIDNLNINYQDTAPTRIINNIDYKTKIPSK